MNMTRWMPRAFAGLLITTALGACTAADEGRACDRNCLIKLTDDYLAGLAKHSADGLPLAENVAFVENVTPLKVGEGLWKDTTGGPTQFSVHVPDEANQTAGWIGMIQRDGKPTIVAIRLKLDGDGKITEAEHLYSAINEPQLANVETPRAGLLADVPEANRLSHGELIKIGASYYDALDDNDGTLMPFAADCERHENGMVTAGANAGPGPNGAGASPIARDCAGQLTSKVMTYITTIGNRRVFAADPQTGLVMGLSHFHHPMDFAPYEVTALDGTKIMYTRDNQMKFDPFDLPAAHIFKIGADGKVHEIEAMGFMAPLNSPSGWENEPAPANSNAPKT
ncbi:MAG: hypothetical protein BGO08_11785 [Altererythrobacter sp. 66-12]|nr:MAG: hypothetical protein BGO08_11785 [Altererythrobacter sp. 66-12]